MDLKEILNKVKDTDISVEEAYRLMQDRKYEDLGFAKIDTDRRNRQGTDEVVMCSGKSDEQLLKIFSFINEKYGEVLGTRATKEQYELIKKHIPEVTYDEESGILMVEKKDKLRKGLIAVCSAGTADIPVAREAELTARFMGSNVKTFYDIGICGIHRLLDNIPEIRKANCIVAVAGMEGALAGVISGLVDVPVIGVPTSVGYGAGFEGLSALLTMINSCANGVSVVNIDNGYGAGYIASRINLKIGGNE